MNKKFASGLNITLLIFGLQACKEEQPAKLNISATVEAQATKQAAATTPLPERFRRVLVGMIDNQLPIQMEISRVKDNIWGRYFYEKKRDGNYLRLQGKIDNTGAVKLTEYDGDKETGTFTGKLINEEVNGESTMKLSGNWTSAKDGKTLPLELVERRFELGGGLKITSKEQSEDLKAQKASINTTTAQLAGSGKRAENFNKAITAFIGQQVQRFKNETKPDDRDAARAADDKRPGNALDLNYEVKYADKNLISILYTTYTYTGGAHGNATSNSFNYDLNQDRMLTLEDLFTPNSNYIKVISDHCINALKQRKISDDGWIRSGAGAKKENYPSWNIVPQGLLITFDAYQVAAYAVGPQEVIIPFSALKGVIKPGGPLEAVVK